MKKISIIIPSLNEEKCIGLTLARLKELKGKRKDIEIILVDGGSKDRTRQIAAKYADKIIVRAPKGHGDAGNAGARAANGRILAFLDADTIPGKNWLNAIDAAFLGGDKKAEVLIGPIRASTGSAFLRAIHLLRNATARVLAKFGVPALRGQSFAISKKAFVSVGRFNADLQAGDDMELGKRLVGKGKLAYDGNFSVSTSMRRYEKKGYFQTELSYWPNLLKYVLFKKRRKYPPVR